MLDGSLGFGIRARYLKSLITQKRDSHLAYGGVVLHNSLKRLRIELRSEMKIKKDNKALR